MVSVTGMTYVAKVEIPARPGCEAIEEGDDVLNAL
jgi:hypothetical protein